MSLMALGVGFIDASTADKTLEVLLVCSLMDRQVAFSAPQVSCRLLEVVLVCNPGALLLLFKKLFDGAGSGDLLPNRFVLPQISFWCLMCEQVTFLL